MTHKNDGFIENLMKVSAPLNQLFVFRVVTFNVSCTLLPTLFIGLPHFVLLLFIYYAKHIATYIFILFCTMYIPYFLLFCL